VTQKQSVSIFGHQFDIQIERCGDEFIAANGLFDKQHIHILLPTQDLV
jgi:hypothetical protein